MKPISIAAIATAMPIREIDNEFFGQNLKESKNKMFMGTNKRRHLGRDDNASDLIVRASKKIMDELNLDGGKDIDIIITNVSIPDQPFNGCGAVVSEQLGAKVKYIFDLHNTGCVSFIHMIDLARALMTANNVKTALVASVQSAAGRIFSQEDVKTRPQAAIPGDGCGVAYLVNDDKSPIISLVQENYPAYSNDMYASFECGRKWWEAGQSSGHIDFNPAKTAKITVRGNKLVPTISKQACKEAGIRTEDLDYLITNQPNIFFLRNWREALQLSEEKHLHTFEKYANLFGAGIPVTLCENIHNNRVQEGDIICLSGFSHAGDYAAACILKWGGQAFIA